MKRQGLERTDIDRNKKKMWEDGGGGVCAGVVNDKSIAPPCEFPLLDHSYVCLCMCFFLCGVINVCVVLRGIPCLPSKVSELSQWESCVTATGRRTSPASMSLSNAACSVHHTPVRQQAEHLKSSDKKEKIWRSIWRSMYL